MTQTKNIFLGIAFLYLIFILDLFFPFSQFGIIPRTQKGLIGIFTSPFLHANLKHIISNTIPLAVLLLVLYHFYPKQAFSVIIITIIVGGTLVWLLGRQANHIGASGLIYGLVAFLTVNGFIAQKFIPLLISMELF